jgi:hypothetical protein
MTLLNKWLVHQNFTCKLDPWCQGKERDCNDCLLPLMTTQLVRALKGTARLKNGHPAALARVSNFQHIIVRPLERNVLRSSSQVRTIDGFGNMGTLVVISQ